MPAPKLFKKFSSKSNNSSESSSVPDVPANDEKDDALQTATVTSDGLVPGHSDSPKEACMVAHQELPHVQGVEKFLNEIGMSIIALRFLIPQPVRVIIDVYIPSSADL